MLPSNNVEIYVCYVSVDIKKNKKKLAPYFETNKKLIFEGSILGVPGGIPK